MLFRSDIGLDDNFFELGGHSLLALQIVGRLKAHHHREVPLRTLFEHPVLEDFAQAVAAMPAAVLGSESDDLRTVPRGDYSAQIVNGTLVIPAALRRRLTSVAAVRTVPPRSV